MIIQAFQLFASWMGLNRSGKKEKLEATYAPASTKSLGPEDVRRRRLVEAFLRDVCRLKPAESARMAEEMASGLTDDIECFICARMGHPNLGGEEIPVAEGRCCRAGNEYHPLSRLSELQPGDESTICFLVPRNGSRLDRLAPLGIVPGNHLVLHSVRPAVVVGVGETILAFDHSVADDIFVTARRSRP